MKRLLIIIALVTFAVSLPVYAEDAQPAIAETETAVDLPSYAEDIQPVIAEAETAEAVVEEETAVDEPEEDTTLEPEVVFLEPRKKRQSVPFGLMVGIYHPTDMRVKEVFGQRWVRYGLRPILVNTPEKWRPTLDVSLYSLMHSDNRATIIPVTGGFIRGFAQQSDFPMFVSLHAGPCYYRVNSPLHGINRKGWGLTTNATVGVTLGRRLAIEGRYEFMDEFGGFDFSAFTVSATLRVFNARL